MIITKQINVTTNGNSDMVNITESVEQEIRKLDKIKNGIVTVFVQGATGGITTIEYEEGLIKDFPDLFEKLIPSRFSYSHNNTWHDGNGHSHLRASLLGPSLTVPFVHNALTLGTWQQIVFIDFDTRPRNRSLILQIIGE